MDPRGREREQEGGFKVTLKEIMNVMDRFAIVEVLDHATGDVIGFCSEDYDVTEDVMECEVMYMDCVAFDAPDDPDGKYPRVMGMTGLQVAVHFTDYER